MIPLWAISVRAPPGHEDRTAAQLEEILGVPTVVYRHEDTGAVTVTAYVEKNIPTRSRLAAALQVPARAISIAKVRRENWAESWKRHFKPIQIGRALLIKPPWSRRRALPGQRVVIIDPGLSFGTGHHETTAYCLARLCHCRDRSRLQSFLDIGTGSGILAIAAGKMGYKPVMGFDNDPDAVRSAQRNARKNRVSIRVFQADLNSANSGKFEVICANLTYDVLCSNAATLSRLLTSDGQLIVAGILEAQFPIVTKSLQRFGLTFVQSNGQNNWRSGQFAFQSVVQRKRA